MRVSDLIQFRDELKSKLDLLEITSAVDSSCGVLTQILDHNPNVKSPIAQEKIHSALVTFKELGNNARNTISALKASIDDVNQDIDKLAATTIIKKDNYPQCQYYKKPNLVTQSDDVIKSVYERLRLHSSLRYPGMQLICQASYLSSEMVVNDPLYLCDHEVENIDKTLEQFNDIYKRRVMKYVIPTQPDRSLDLLPQNQFGFILSWLHFNYYELETLELYLKSVITALRPGGVFMFSYNNGDLLSSCILSEYSGMSFIPKRKLIETCIKSGFEIIESYDLPNTDDDVKYISWIEIKKPGTLTSSKAAQSLGLIERK